MVYQARDINSVLYAKWADPLVADGSSNEIKFGVPGGCPDSELVFNVGDLDTGESITFILEDNAGGSFADTPFQIRGLTAAGVYTMPINNRMIKGSSLRVKHDVTLPSGSDGVKVNAHVRPFPFK